MSETVKCSHCGALYELRPEKPVSGDQKTADCVVCGTRMESSDQSSIAHYELIRMPDGTDV